MTDRDDISEILDGWLADGPTYITDRALESALDLIDHTTQRRVLRPPWRTRPMTFPLRAAVAALIAVVAIGGFLMLRPPTTNVGQPSPSTSSPTGTSAPPTPTPLLPPTVAPTAPIAGTVLAQGQMALAPGTTYSLLSFEPPFSIRGGGSWWLMGDGPGHAWFDNGPNEPNPPDHYTLGIVVAAKVLPVVSGRSIVAPADLIAWLQGRSDLALDSPRAVTVGRLHGTALVGTVRAGATTNAAGAIDIICSADSPCKQELGNKQETGNETGVWPGRAFEIIVVPVQGQTLVIDADGTSPTWSVNAPSIDTFLAGLSFPGVAN